MENAQQPTEPQIQQPEEFEKYQGYNKKRYIFWVLGLAFLLILGGFVALAKYTTVWPFSESVSNLAPMFSVTPTPSVFVSPPAAPSELTAVGAGTVVKLDWKDNSNNEVEFKIGRRIEGGNWATIGSVEADSITFRDDELKSGKYEYDIAACNTSGCSDYSNIVLVTISGSSSPTPKSAVSQTPKPASSSPPAYQETGWTQNPVSPVNPTYVIWSGSRKLTWDDFKSGVKSNPNESASAVTPIDSTAVTSSKCETVGRTYTCTNRIDSFRVVATMIPSLSYVEPDGKTNNLLAHEQIHFDIAEVFARRLKKQLQVLIGTTNASMNALLAAKNDKEAALSNEFEAMQQLYDVNTNHSLNSANQNKWSICIQTWLSTDPATLNCQM